jgi:hypothetical protein
LILAGALFLCSSAPAPDKMLVRLCKKRQFVECVLYE